MYQLHIGNKNYSSWSLRPWVLLKTLGIPFEERMTPFSGSDNWAQFRRFSPNGKVPCLVDGDTVVWDSLAICEYVAEAHVGVWPADPVARAWARCAASEMHSGFSALRSVCTMNCGIRVELTEQSAALQRDLTRVDELLREGLDRFGGPFLAASTFGAVDAFFAPVAYRFQTYGLTFSAPVSDYFKRLLALPAMCEWDASAVAETWRDPEHEDEVLQVGRIVEDRRAG